MKTYTGYRLPGDEGRSQAHVTVHEDGQQPRPLNPRFDLRNHSPDAFEWGYAGSGPAQLALALVADVLGDDEAAQDVYQQLKFRVIGRLPHDGWSLSEAELRQAIRTIQDRDRGPSR